MPKLDVELSKELIQLVRDLEAESQTQYMAVVRRCSKLRSLIKGDPADWYAPDANEWREWSAHPGYKPEEHDGEYDYNINYSQAWWQILQSAVQTLGIPGAIFRAQNQQQKTDQEAAATGQQIIDYQYTVFDFRDLLMGIYRLCYTDGLALAYTRHVKDRSKYGETNIPQEMTEQQVIRPEGYDCFACGEFTPKGMTGRSGTGAIYCPRCDNPLHEENYSPERTGPVSLGKQDNMVPNGREITDLYGALETLLPWWAKDLEHSAYAIIKIGMPKEEIIAAFPDLEDEIGAAASDAGKTGNIEREQARAPQGSSGTASSKQFPTYYRVWLRPSNFYRIESEKRAKLLKDYPDGIFFQFVGEVFLDSDKKRGCWNEKMEAKLCLIRPFKGDGMYTPSIGDSGVPLHESGQTAWNMWLEAMEHAAFPQGLIDEEVFSGQAIKDTRVRPGTWKEIHLPGGKKLKECWDQMKSTDISASVQGFLAMEQPMGEFLMGTVAALQGQAITNVRTSSGQSQSRNQGLQRQAPSYGAVKAGLAIIQGQMVNEFLENQNAETYYEITGETGDMQQRKIELSPERGKVNAYPEASEAVPTTWAQTQDAIDKVLDSQNPYVQEWARHPANAKVMFNARGIPGLVAPGKVLADKYERIIQELLQAGTIEEPQPDGSKKPSIAIPFHPVLDDPKVAIPILREWAAKKEGMAAQQNNAKGFAAVEMFAEQASEALAQQSQEQPKPSDPQRMEITKLQEENKHAIAELETKSEEVLGRLESETDKWVESLDAKVKLLIQARQNEHERANPQNQD